MNIEELKIAGYERVCRAEDPATGLRAFIAVHDTTLGPALGGMRIWPYADEAAALKDVLRLAEGMTYKSAIAGTGLGGGKSVIVGDPKEVRRPETLRAMGRFIDSFEGRYITAEDVNTRIVDLEEVRQATRWVTGLSRERGGSGNPSPYTARGVYLGIRTCLERVFGNADPKGRKVVVQGAGAVASSLIGHLVEAGAEVTACDIAAERMTQLRGKYPQVKEVPAAKVFDEACDVFSPHALGAVINDETIPRLNCKIVAGAANNQLAEDRHGDLLRSKGILFAPDFVINAGGIINVGCELLPGGYDEKVALEKIDNIQRALRQTFDLADSKAISTGRAAVEVARGIIEKARAQAPRR